MTFNPFKRFFEDEPDAPETGLEECHAAVEFGRTPYFQTFMLYLAREIDRPLELADMNALMKSGARNNAFREIRQHLLDQIRKAEQVIQAAEETRNA